MTAHEQYHEHRKESAVPRWRKVWTLRKQGKTYAEIGKALGASLWAAFKAVTKYESYLLK